MIKILDGWENHIVGLDCTLVSMSNILHYYGFDYSPELLLGIGCGLSFIYINRTRPVSKANLEGIIWMVSGKASDIHRSIAGNLGIHYVERIHFNPEDAWTRIKESIDCGRPVMAKTNLYEYADYLDNFGFFNHRPGSDMHRTGLNNPKSGLGGINNKNQYMMERIKQDPLFKKNYYHTTVIVGYDSKRDMLYLSENFFTKIQQVPRSVFFDAMSKTLDNPFFEDVLFYLPGKLLPLDFAIYMSIKMNIFTMKNPFIDEMGIPALERLVDELPHWWELIKDETIFKDSIYYILGMSTQVTGGGMYRKRYSRFLALANRYCKDFKLEKAAARYRNISQIWTMVINKLQQSTTVEKPEKILKSEKFLKLLDTLKNEEKQALDDLEEGCGAYVPKYFA